MIIFISKYKHEENEDTELAKENQRVTLATITILTNICLCVSGWI